MNKIYLDNAATTSLDKDVLAKMMPYFCDVYGNASSLHSFGREALKAVDKARDDIAEIIGAHASEIYFTSGGTESDNWALKGIAETYKKLGKHIITTKIEHHAILETCAELEKKGYEITYVGVDKDGRVNVDEIRNAIREDTILVSVMTANNEIGTIQPIKEIGAICKERGVFFHTDAVQAIGTIDINVDRDNIDMLSVSAHKFHGPKGVGFLYIRSGIRPQRQIEGGHQERKQRAGTTNTPGVVGMAEALKMTVANRAEYTKRVSGLRDYFIDRVLSEIPYSHLNGGRENRLPSNANLSFDYIEGESILFLLDTAGIAVSSGSACSSGSLDPSHVVLALGVSIEQAHSSIRFSLGRETTKEEIDFTVDTLKKIIAKLRKLSPLWDDEKGVGNYV